MFSKGFSEMMQFMSINSMALLGGLLLVGFLGGRLAHWIKAPRVSGYLVTGMLLSQGALGLISEEMVQGQLRLVTDLALAVIAFMIGGSLHLKKVRRLGGQIGWISMTQAVGACLLVTGGVLLGFYLLNDGGPDLMRVALPWAMVIGAMSAATAPAATLAVVQEYGAKGPMTDLLFGVVAVDDAIAIILFAFALAVGLGLNQARSIDLTGALLEPMGHILVALALGLVLGWILIWILDRLLHRKLYLSVLLGMILFNAGLAEILESSALLANMVLGMVVTNRYQESECLFIKVERLEEPIFTLFFLVAGAHLDLRLLGVAGPLALVIVVSRFVGKLLGTSLGAIISKAPQAAVRYLGLALLPKAGVTVGLVLLAQTAFGPSELTGTLVNAVLASVLINEVISPFFLKFALIRSGEAGQDPHHQEEP